MIRLLNGCQNPILLCQIWTTLALFGTLALSVEITSLVYLSLYLYLSSLIKLLSVGFEAWPHLTSQITVACINWSIRSFESVHNVRDVRLQIACIKIIFIIYENRCEGCTQAHRKLLRWRGKWGGLRGRRETGPTSSLGILAVSPFTSSSCL